MKRINLAFATLGAAALAAVLLPSLAFAQSSPGLYYGQVPTAAQWNSYFASKQDTLGFTPVNKAGDTMLGPLVTFAPTTASAGFNLPQGTAPSAPSNGDLWTTSAGLFVQINGNTVGPFVGASGSTFAGNAPLSVAFPSGVITYSLNYDSAFALSDNKLALAPIAAGALLGNSSGSAAEPGAVQTGTGVLTALANPLNDSGGVLGTALASADLFIGNGSGIAAGVPMSGDATISNTGALTLATSGVTAGTYGDVTHSTQVTFDAKGRATSASSVAITHASEDLPLSGGTMSGNIAMGGNSVTGAANLSGSTLASTVATGTSPLTVASTTVVPNLNVSQLLGSTWASPGAIGSTTPNAGAFNSLNITSGGSVPSNGLYNFGTNETAVSSNGIGVWIWAPTVVESFLPFVLSNANSAALENSAASSTVPTVIPNRAATSTGIGAKAAGTGSLIGSGVDALDFDSTGILLPALTTGGMLVNAPTTGRVSSQPLGSNVQAALAIAANANGGLALTDGTITTGDCLKWGPGVQDAGSACGGGGGSPGGSTGAVQYNNGGAFGGVTVASGDLMAGGGSGAPTDTGVPIFIGSGNGTTNNYTAFQTSCNAGGAYIPAGTYVVDLLSATTMCTPPSGTVFRGAGQGKTILQFVAADTSHVNVFNINANKIDFRDMTIQIGSPVGGTMILYNMENSDGLNLINDEISSNAVEGLTIGGTATAGDTLKVAFLRNGTTTTVTTTVTSGQTTAQMATAVAESINANGTVSGWGAVATASGSFVGIAQPDSLTPQASYTLSVTGSATETLTAGFSNTTAVFNNQTNGDEADDVLVQNPYMHDILYNVLKPNTSTQINKRWKFIGGNYDRVFEGAVNLNSPEGTFDDVDVSGISVGAVGLNSSDSLPIACSHVTNMTIRGVRLRGTYDQNTFHFEQGCNGLTTYDDVALVSTSGNSGVGYNGTCVFSVDNNIGGTSSGNNDMNLGGITCRKNDANSQGYGVWLSLVSSASIRDSVGSIVISGWPGCLRNDGVANFNFGPLVCTNFGAPTGTTAVVNTQATGIIGAIDATSYATVLSNTGAAPRAASCTGTTC